jgi:RNA polymerase sigma factor (sigma-70 family)
LTGLDLADSSGPDASVDTVAIDAALTRLEAIDAEKARVVELRYFGGLTLEETAEAMDISLATVKRHWQAARIWLFDALN